MREKKSGDLLTTRANCQAHIRIQTDKSLEFKTFIICNTEVAVLPLPRVCKEEQQHYVQSGQHTHGGQVEIDG